ncbi:hypothetical protein [Lysobacter fragariae]
MRLILVLAALASMGANAAQPTPEITRPVGTPMADGVVHTVRGIPEACARLEGVFTGDATQPYRFAPVKSHPNCQPRARYVAFDKAKPSREKGWKLNDVIRVPSGQCPSLQAVVHVWRKPVQVRPPELDAQGRSRIYLQDANEQAKARGAPKVTMYAAQMELEGKACGG